MILHLKNNFKIKEAVMKIGLLVGSLRKESYNKKIAEIAKK